MVLHQIAKADPQLLRQVKRRILPEEGSLESSSDDPNAPPKYPPFSIMDQLLPHFISLTPTLSRSAAELIFALCEEKGSLCFDLRVLFNLPTVPLVDVFLSYCGLGHGAGLLQAKGLLS